MSPLWFPQGEYEARIEALRVRLDERGLDGLLLTWDANIRYYTGFRQIVADSMLTRPSAAILPRVGEPVLFVHQFLAGDAVPSVWFPDVRRYMQLDGPPVAEIAAELRSRGMRRLGAELGLEQRLGMPYRDFTALRGALSETAWVDAADLIWHQRARKSPAELECLRQAGSATARAYEAVLPQVAPGMSEREVARLLSRAMIDSGADEVGFILMTSGEGNYGRISGLPTDRRLARGDMLWVDMGARVNDYWADFSRAGVIGGATDQQKRMQATVAAVTAKGIARAAPGVPVSEIVQACNEEIKRRGHDITFVAGRIGHGLGLNITEHPHVATYDLTVLEPGMVITVEPGIVEPYGVFHIEENLIITDRGSEVISSAGRELWTI